MSVEEVDGLFGLRRDRAGEQVDPDVLALSGGLPWNSAASTAIAPFIPPSRSVMDMPTGVGRPSADAFIAPKPLIAWVSTSWPGKRT